MSVVADQVFVEIPARRFERTLARRPLVERVRGGAFDGRFGGKRKFHAVLVMLELPWPLWLSLWLPFIGFILVCHWCCHGLVVSLVRLMCELMDFTYLGQAGDGENVS